MSKKIDEYEVGTKFERSGEILRLIGKGLYEVTLKWESSGLYVYPFSSQVNKMLSDGTLKEVKK